MTKLIMLDGSELNTMQVQANALKEYDSIAKDAKANADHIKKHIRLTSALKWFTQGIITKVVKSNRKDAKALEALAIELGATKDQLKACEVSSETIRITIQD